MFCCHLLLCYYYIKRAQGHIKTTYALLPPTTMLHYLLQYTRQQYTTNSRYLTVHWVTDRCEIHKTTVFRTRSITSHYSTYYNTLDNNTPKTAGVSLPTQVIDRCEMHKTTALRTRQSPLQFHDGFTGTCSNLDDGCGSLCLHEGRTYDRTFDSQTKIICSCYLRSELLNYVKFKQTRHPRKGGTKLLRATGQHRSMHRPRYETSLNEVSPGRVLLAFASVYTQ